MDAGVAHNRAVWEQASRKCHRENAELMVRARAGSDLAAAALGLADRCRYVVAEVPAVPRAGGSADLVYTGKGALI